jgi:aminopeptidase C
LRPVKEEQVFDEPIILLFHDVVSNTDIEKMKELAIPQVNNEGNTVSIYVESSRLNDKNSTIVKMNSYVIVGACFCGRLCQQHWNGGRLQNQ